MAMINFDEFSKCYKSGFTFTLEILCTSPQRTVVQLPVYRKQIHVQEQLGILLSGCKTNVP